MFNVAVCVGTYTLNLALGVAISTPMSPCMICTVSVPVKMISGPFTVMSPVVSMSTVVPFVLTSPSTCTVFSGAAVPKPTRLLNESTLTVLLSMLSEFTSVLSVKCVLSSNLTSGVFITTFVVASIEVVVESISTSSEMISVRSPVIDTSPCTVNVLSGSLVLIPTRLFLPSMLKIATDGEEVETLAI